MAGDEAIASCRAARSFATSLEPTSPVPSITTIIIFPCSVVVVWLRGLASRESRSSRFHSTAGFARA